MKKSRVLAIFGVIFAIGVIGLPTLDHYWRCIGEPTRQGSKVEAGQSAQPGQELATPADQRKPICPDPWWHYLAFHVLALLGSVGFVGGSLELFTRGELFSEFITKMRMLFDEEPELAKSLTDETRQRLVKNSLTAHLGSREGQAIYNSIVSPYFEKPSRFRRNVAYNVTVGDLEEDIKLGEGAGQVVLSREKYYKLTVSWRFDQEYRKYDSVVCVLVEDNKELYDWFDKAGCLYREVVVLAEEDREKIIKLLDSNKDTENIVERIRQNIQNFVDKVFSRKPQQDIHNIVKKIFDLRVHIRGERVEAGKPELRNNKSVLIPLRSEKQFKEQVSFEIHLTAVLAKSRRYLPFHIVQPSSNPRVVFEFPAAGITHVVTVPVFAGKTPFQPEVTYTERQVEVTIPPEVKPGRGAPEVTPGVGAPDGTPAVGDSEAKAESWAFPNSAVIFFWDDDKRPSPQSATR